MPSTRIAIAGLGAIGRVLAKRIAAGVPGLELTCVAVRDRAKIVGIEPCPIVPPP